jgi:uncharacterized damage-inducible protein DinB
MSLAEVAATMKTQTHRVARMQCTWFRRDDPRIHWLDASLGDPFDEAVRIIERASKRRSRHMDAEIETLSRLLRSLLDRVCEGVQGLSEAQLNWCPPIAGANSVYAIVAHTLGNARGWVLGIACGQPVDRDRPAEFRASGRDAAEMVADGERLSREIDAALAALTPADLDRRLVPLPKYWGEGEPYEISVREALLHVVEHASLHLGQLQITRDLAMGQA